jgi:hypothetical protein
MFKALNKGANTLKAKTISNLRRPSLNKGVKVRPNRASNEVAVNIMGDYRLKWFEKGTDERFTRRRAYKGIIQPEHFFLAARNDEESLYSSMMASITDSLNRIQ